MESKVETSTGPDGIYRSTAENGRLRVIQLPRQPGNEVGRKSLASPIEGAHEG